MKDQTPEEASATKYAEELYARFRKDREENPSHVFGFQTLATDSFVKGSVYKQLQILALLRSDECSENGRLTWGPHIADWLEKKLKERGGEKG